MPKPRGPLPDFLSREGRADLLTYRAPDMTGRTRVLRAASGVIPAAIAMPLVLRVWCPGWFVWTWVIGYVAISVLFATLVYHKSTALREQCWSVAVSVLFAALPASAAYWSVRPQDWWATLAIVMMFVALEVCALPILPMIEWRIGSVLVGASVAVSGFFVIGPFLVLLFCVAFATIVQDANRVRLLKVDLDVHLDAAQRTLCHDAMTGLLNRRGLALVFEEYGGGTITLALIDVDRFKAINDTHGHHVGDQVLVAVANELRSRLGERVDLARLGGDEFVAVLEGEVELDPSLARRVHTTFLLHGRRSPIEVGLSIGVTHGSSANAAQRLLSQAGFAMRESKRSGSTLSQFGIDLRERLDRTLEITALAHGSSDEGELVPVGQAIVQDGRIIGCELLVRWARPDSTTLLPGQFLPMAVEAGLMSTINETMLEHAVRFASHLGNDSRSPFVSVNITAPYLGESGFCERVSRLLEAYDVAPRRLMIEITETEQLAGSGRWESAATALRKLGVQLAIDDFGTGYSSIERLQHLPITHLKFDQSLVQTVNGPFGEIVAGVARFAAALDIAVIAEGVETTREHDAMRALNIDACQGYLFHHPEALEDLEDRIIAQRAIEHRALDEDIAGTWARPASVAEQLLAYANGRPAGVGLGSTAVERR